MRPHPCSPRPRRPARRVAARRPRAAPSPTIAGADASSPAGGVIEGTVLYQGPRPCSRTGTSSAPRSIFVFDRQNPPPPNGLGATVVNFADVTGDTLFADEPRNTGSSDCIARTRRLHRHDHGERARSPSRRCPPARTSSRRSTTPRATSCRPSSSASCRSRATSAAGTSTPRPPRSTRATSTISPSTSR